MKKQTTEYLKNEPHQKKWFKIDADGLVLGRLASEVSKKIMGKDNKFFTPSVDSGNFIVIYNADKVKVTGKKLLQKIYYRHSGYPGGLKETTLKDMMLKKPEEVIRIAVKGMLPKNRLGRKMINKLKVYKGTTDKHISQNPELLILNKL